MSHAWTLEDVERVKELVARGAAKGPRSFFQRRKRRNIERNFSPFSRELFWKVFVVAIGTTQEDSSESGPPARLSRAAPFPLSFGCLHAANERGALEPTIRRVLVDYGFWRRDTLVQQIGGGFRHLEVDREPGSLDWQEIESMFNRLAIEEIGAAHRKTNERRAARVLQGSRDGLPGLGPKQSRNVLQMLGLTVHEIPLDGRVLEVLRTLPSRPPFERKLLAGEKSYSTVLDSVQSLCLSAGVSPCLFDAAAFAGDEFDEYPDDEPF